METSQSPETIPQELLKKIRRIEIRVRRLVTTLFLGEYHSVFKGQGLEFSEVREYEPGDDIRFIDWNVTARIGYPFVKKFVEERELTVILAVDLSASELFGTTGRTKNEVAAEICALIAFSAIRNNDKVGLLAFTDRLEKFIPPRKGREHVLRVIRELLYLNPQGKGTDISLALGYLNRILKRRSVVFLVSDFLAQGYQAALKITGKRHDAIAISIEDPKERELPSVGFITLDDLETGKQLTIDSGSSAVRAHYALLAQEQARSLDRTFQSAKIDKVRIDTHRSYVEPLMAFFRTRPRRG